MNKLTRDQADYLIEKIINNSDTPNRLLKTEMKDKFYDTVQLAFLEDIKQVINIYTEKEFPGFTHKERDGDIEFGAKKYKDCDDESGLLIDIWHKDNTDGSLSLFYLDAEEFKQFTEGCLNIVKYIGDVN